MKNYEENIEHFKSNGYCIIKKCVSQELLDVVTQYALFDEIQNFNSEISRGKYQVPNAHSVYADPAMESLLLYLQPIVEKNTGLDLYPTYSYYRVYRDGDELVRHKDRPACEISVTLCFNYDYNDKDFSWPIYVEHERVDQLSGDIVIYRGCDLRHHREKMNINDIDAWHIQGFFHYVDANGPHSEWKFDKRKNIGYVTRENTQAESKKSYIRYNK
jgi:hypothetical protein